MEREAMGESAMEEEKRCEIALAHIDKLIQKHHATTRSSGPSASAGAAAPSRAPVLSTTSLSGSSSGKAQGASSVAAPAPAPNAAQSTRNGKAPASLTATFAAAIASDAAAAEEGSRSRQRTVSDTPVNPTSRQEVIDLVENECNGGGTSLALEKNYLRGVVICAVNYGAIDAGQIDNYWSRKVPAAGGQISRVDPKLGYDAVKTTHVVADPKMTSADLAERLRNGWPSGKGATAPGVWLLPPSWLTKCFKEGRRVSERLSQGKMSAEAPARIQNSELHNEVVVGGQLQQRQASAAQAAAVAAVGQPVRASAVAAAAPPAAAAAAAEHRKVKEPPQKRQKGAANSRKDAAESDNDSYNETDDEEGEEGNEQRTKKRRRGAGEGIGGGEERDELAGNDSDEDEFGPVLMVRQDFHALPTPRERRILGELLPWLEPRRLLADGPQAIENAMDIRHKLACQRPVVQTQNSGEEKETEKEIEKGKGKGEGEGKGAGVVSGSDGAAQQQRQQQQQKQRPKCVNAHIIEPLQELADIYEAFSGADKDGRSHAFRAIQLKKTIASLRRHPKKITKYKEIPAELRAKKDSSALGRIQEIISTGMFKDLLETKRNPHVAATLAFRKIWGVGMTTAKELVQANFYTIEQLRQNGVYMLNCSQKIGLKYYEELQERIPRDEVEMIHRTVQACAEGIVPGVTSQVCGSYRRGKATCGDVDVLFAPPRGQNHCDLLNALIAKLNESGFLTDNLSMPKHRHNPKEADTFMGVCRLPGEGRLHRRIDIKVYPSSMYAFALLYFTGSDYFNRSMRYFAKQRGLTLSDKGLAVALRDNGKRIEKGASCVCRTEEEVFAALGLEYRAPKDRSIDEDGLPAQQQTPGPAEDANCAASSSAMSESRKAKRVCSRNSNDSFFYSDDDSEG